MHFQALITINFEPSSTLGVTKDKHPILALSMGPVTCDGQSFQNGTVYGIF